MDPYADLLNHRRHLTPPSGAVDQLEQRVMAQLDQLPSVRRRQRIMVGSALLVGAVLMFVMIAVIRPRAKSTPPPDFIESIVMLDNHVCIWLEIANPNSRNGHSHE
jgi:hypothetical protein